MTARDTLRYAKAPCSAIASDVWRGLTATTKSLPPYLFYDDAGSRLYERITELPEYYPTRAEREIFEALPAPSSTTPRGRSPAPSSARATMSADCPWKISRSARVR